MGKVGKNEINSKKKFYIFKNYIKNVNIKIYK
jgi:hypothetical protein